MAPMSFPSAAETTSTAAEVADAFREARDRTLGLVSSVSDDDLERVHSTLMSPLVWDLGHIAAFEDLWLVHRFGGRPLLREDLAEIYDAFETPRSKRGDLEFLRPDAARDYLAEVRDAMLYVLDEQGLRDGGMVHEMVLRHEQQHNETMLQTLQLARLSGYELPDRRPSYEAPIPRLTGLELIEVPAGPFDIGAPKRGFAY